MKYGEIIKSGKNLMRLNGDLLAAAGYKQIPSHTYGHHHDEEWITGSFFMRQAWPRFHLIRRGAVWYLHRDLRPDGDRHDTIVSDGEIIREIRRLCLLRMSLRRDARIKRLHEKTIQ